MNCDKCNSTRIAEISGKCRDLFTLNFQGIEESGYVTKDIGIGSDDFP